jgi:hypothetical protein
MSTFTHMTARLQAIASAFVVTLAMLSGINGLANHEAQAAMASVAASSAVEA